MCSRAERGVRRFFISAVAITAAACGGDRRPEAEPLPAERHIAVQQWDTLWAMGGVEDSLLLRPFFLSAAGDRLFLYDGGARRILALDAGTGEVKWTFGREGEGPDEFRGVRDIKADGSGGVYALDPRNNRVIHLDAEGRPIRRIPLTEAGPAEQFVPLADGRLVLLANSTEGAFAVLGADGAVVERLPLEWEEFGSLHSIARQGYLATDGQDWAFGFSFGNGWFAFQEDLSQSGVRRYVEHTEFPRITQTETPQGVITAMAEYAACSACSLALADGHLYVHFGGYGDAPREVVDRYELATGRYAGSFRLPVRASRVEAARGTFYLLFDEPYPTLLAVTPRGN